VDKSRLIIARSEMDWKLSNFNNKKI
jgi:hypothetical protein